MTMHLRETRLGNPNAQDRDGGFVSPVNSTNAGSAIVPVTIAFSALTIDSTQVNLPGYQVQQAGYGFMVNPASDPATVIYVSVDQVNYIRLSPGVRFETAQRFERLFVKKAATLPNTSQSFELDIFQSHAGRLIAESPSSAAQAAGAPLWTVTLSTINTGGLGSNIAPFRATRRRVVICNQGPGDIYMRESSAVDATNGELLPSGATTTFYTTADIFALPSVNSTIVTAREEYST